MFNSYIGIYFIWLRGTLTGQQVTFIFHTMEGFYERLTLMKKQASSIFLHNNTSEPSAYCSSGQMFWLPSQVS